MIDLTINNLITVEGVAVLVVHGWQFYLVGTWQ